MSWPVPQRPAADQIRALAAELAAADPGLPLLGPLQPGSPPALALELQRLSRDYFDYSPVLVPLLEGRQADLVVKAGSLEQVVLVAGACARQRVPLTVRGAGTGNYGQCVPLQGGVVLDLAGLNRLRRLEPATGVVEVEAGCGLAALDQQLAPHGRAQRLAPSTYRSASVGGFIAGGSGGIGSLRWGFLHDPGNLLGLEVVTVEPEPRVLQLDAAASQPLNHAYGTNGILTALRLPTCEAVAWQQLVVGFVQWEQAVAAARALGASALELNALCLLEAPICQQLPWPSGCPAPGGEHRLLLLAAPAALEVLPAWLAAQGGDLLWQAPQGVSRGLPLRELTWNHTTLHWRSHHPDWTYLQMLLPQPEEPCLAALRQRWGSDLLWHLEGVRHQGAPRLACLPLLRWQGPERLAALMAHCRELGAFLFNPHVLTVEDGGLGVIDADQVAAKAAYDPAGLLNPGKLRGWLERA
ncbi:MAG: FAD-binding oxidoreductase [Cyanobacteriota bacterium]